VVNRPTPAPTVLYDVNALVALALTTHQHHRAAHRHLATVTSWATCPVTEAALLRLLLNPAVTGRPRETPEVAAVLSGFRTDPRWHWVADDSTLAAPMIDIAPLTGHQQVTDLHLVNLCARVGLTLATFDTALPTWLVPTDRRHVEVIPS
jgi:toxin-antitoxin system PIN domain toxin